MSARELEGRVSLVTGASRGIGRAIALELARRGSGTILLARDARALEETAAGCRAHGVWAEIASADLADAAALKAALAPPLERAGRLDHLVNNAGVTGDGLLMRMKRDVWDRVLETNLSGPFEITRLVLPGMIRARYGRIVNISSIVALMGNPGQANYCAAKAGLIGLTKSLAREVASRDITVNAVAPGFIDTDMTRGLEEAARARMTEAIPLGRLGTAEDVAQAVAFLVGPGGAYVTGEVLNVSGGLYM
ncbi:MAG TPA: 3-oxoacyl-[acyl-carrier-protein] reductase [Candidatus Polarisedimenticolia bacterium]|nr:3-oxoacyl-[acyl-carrier-protein] reductase [Candidatus Polarisedimenticolia bacterium]